MASEYKKSICERNPHKYNIIPSAGVATRRSVLSNQFSAISDILKVDLVCDPYILDDIIIRVDKEITRWHIFQGIEINNFKIACIEGYYISKLHPLSLDEKLLIDDSTIIYRWRFINEIVAFLYPLIILKGEDKSKPLHLTLPFVKTVLYSMRYRNVTIDSLIHIFEIFLYHDCCGVKAKP